jgi:hypothetical protein
MTRARISEGITSPNRAWVDLLRANCLTLVEKPGVVNAVSVSRGFAHGHEEERESVIALAQHMAGEYGLVMDSEVRGHFLTIRFTRPAEQHETREPSDGFSLLAKLRALFRLRGESSARIEQREPEEERVPAEVGS